MSKVLNLFDSEYFFVFKSLISPQPVQIAASSTPFINANAASGFYNNADANTVLYDINIELKILRDVTDKKGYQHVFSNDLYSGLYAFYTDKAQKMKDNGTNVKNKIIGMSSENMYKESMTLALPNLRLQQIKTDIDVIKGGKHVLMMECKYGIVENWSYDPNCDLIDKLPRHNKALPALTRSDTMNKAIGKCVRLRVRGYSQPYVVITNSAPCAEEIGLADEYARQFNVFFVQYGRANLSNSFNGSYGYRVVNTISDLQREILSLIP